MLEIILKNGHKITVSDLSIVNLISKAIINKALSPIVVTKDYDPNELVMFLRVEDISIIIHKYGL